MEAATLRDCSVCARSSGRTVLSWLARRNLCQAPVMGPEGAAGKPCRSQQVGICCRSLENLLTRARSVEAAST